ncbi:MAG TPA: hypothetical protein VMG34_13165 [Bacteroidota bacterium]|nr:hypothetical protein [Bacteroidota bacterium]
MAGSSLLRLAFFACVALLCTAIPLHSQQYPINTETPTILPAGMSRAEIGVGHYFDQPFPLSGLEGTLTKLGILRFGFSYDGNVELQFDGTLLDILQVTSREPAFNSAIATTNNVTGDIGDFTLWTKFKLLSEYSHPVSLAIRFGVELPNASNESGLGIDEFDFYSSFLLEKHLSGIRFVLNAGLGILGDPTKLSEQHDTFIYGAGIYTPLAPTCNLVLEAAGRTGHQGIGVYRLANAKAGGDTEAWGVKWRLLGVLSFSRADNSRGAELDVGYDFRLFEPTDN